MKYILFSLLGLVLLMPACADDPPPPCAPICDGQPACGDDGCGGECAPCFDGKPRPPARLGVACRENNDCISNVCLESEYGPPFCTRPCDVAAESCPPGDDAEEGEALCVNYGPENLALLGVQPVPTFDGQLTQFCVKRCSHVDECLDNNLNWEQCRETTFLGLPVHPSLGQIKVCQAPNYHGKEPVDPALCDYEKTVPGKYMSESNLCSSYCAYLQECQVVAADHPMACCAWGCFNQMYDASVPTINADWKTEIKCFVDNHGAYPSVGAANFCSEPPKECQTEPSDPTPPAAEEGWWIQ